MNLEQKIEQKPEVPTRHCKHVKGGCRLTDIDERMVIHEPVCPHRDTHCRHPRCGVRTKMYLQTAHESVCPHRVVQCPNEGCTESFPQAEVAKHAAKDCPYRLVRLACKRKVRAKDVTVSP